MSTITPEESEASPPLRSHRCGELRASDDNRTVSLCGWVQRRRDHGGLRFVDLRDGSGLVQLVSRKGSPVHAALERIAVESVVRAHGRVILREPGQVNAELPTGEVEVQLAQVEVLGPCTELPFSPIARTLPSEEIRLRHRYLDLRRRALRDNILLRARVIASLRRRMEALGFVEIQTPILTASSPEGARDFLVPARTQPGAFYALPQAPQQYKQLLMCAGFERYFQIAPCFRDEDARADRSPGEFYQLDLEMAFATQDEVFATSEPVLEGVFREHSSATATPAPFPRIPYREALERYGSDKPDLRNPLTMRDVTAACTATSMRLLSGASKRGEVVRAIPIPGEPPRALFDRAVQQARELGAGGLSWIAGSPGAARGTLAKHLQPDEHRALLAAAGASAGEALLLLIGPEARLRVWGAKLLAWAGESLSLVEQDAFRLCWIVDYPMYERDPESGRIEFSHNPFSMPQGGLEALRSQPPLSVLAHQYDIVCNGVELSSGAIRNHRPDVMLEAFRIAGYGREEVEARFGGLLRAFQHGAPPHGGLAPGVDRIVMLLAGAENIREVIAFPMSAGARDLMMGAPAPVDAAQLRELGLALAEADPS